ncbi:hypothetical protein CEUSTIGMA_g1983.t1 [Chlamydomonas eustigma]|uniref:Histone RNA hairpin-binding protein RNA-binding domain-containing protein n=1 Tax=Chlamydomonas eustigma TaxID=1157962 RepID=A0A250WUM5_9CHLO|nr:hypothetical protein CEUSTIGMA_g1983.t1 [Chlamydomonas eustigma]|eukprot:GAX74534.1 hypothetical protein CEUSTIGMA_g1983.t1 [Chlamydomonas eustigma]
MIAGRISEPEPGACHSPGIRSADDVHRQMQWQKQIDYGKNTLGYQNYLNLVPKELRKRGDPVTPDASQDISKKRFDGQIRAWRRSLHEYDENSNAEESTQIKSSSDSTKKRERKDISLISSEMKKGSKEHKDLCSTSPLKENIINSETYNARPHKEQRKNEPKTGNKLDGRVVPKDVPANAVDNAIFSERFIDSVHSLPEDGTRAMWDQRGSWLREEVAALTEERIYSPEKSQYWQNLVKLMFAGADACDRALRDKVESEVGIQAMSANMKAMEARTLSLEAQLKMLEDQQHIPQHAAEEALQLRSKVTVLQQEVKGQLEQIQTLSRQIQTLSMDRDAAQKRIDELLAENAVLQQQSEGRMEVIRTMMLQAEGSSSQGVSLIHENNQLQAHCKNLSVNLETNAQVIEKLIELNAELMDNLNIATASAMRAQKVQQQQQQLDPTNPSVTAADSVETLCNHTNGSLSTSYLLPLSQVTKGLIPESGASIISTILPPANPSLHTPSSMPYGSSNAMRVEGTRATSSPLSSNQNNHGLTVLSMQQSQQPLMVSMVSSTSAGSIAAGREATAAAQSSLSAAFEAFLTSGTDEEASGAHLGNVYEPKRAYADSLAMPVPLGSIPTSVREPGGHSKQQSAADTEQRRGVGGLVGGLFNYVARAGGESTS